MLKIELSTLKGTAVRQTVNSICRNLLFTLALMATPAMAEKTAIADEYRVKAALIYNFTQYIEWPDSAFANADSTFVVCVAGHDPFGSSLLAMQKLTYKTRTIVIKYPQTIAEARLCHILYVEDPNTTMLDHDAMNVLGESPVLSISSNEAAMEAGIGIGFVHQAGKVRWTLNLNAVRRARLKVSVKLIEIAVEIIGVSK